MTDLEQAWAEDAARRRRWAAVYAAWGVVVSVLIGGGWIAFELYREWWIWNR